MMGEAKRRGTFEEHKAESIARQEKLDAERPIMPTPKMSPGVAAVFSIGLAAEAQCRNPFGPDPIPIIDFHREFHQ